ncbi:MAG: hypothetical protein HOD92_00865 [Deltaproteobacteria bacterium]|jgi:hypothetical protein|nr:hypothetical protein [Deltaproteobacteria bacterium]MBT7483350.1 hypothetical protein [Candidatus Peregrinibacteria bacterium]
MAKKRKQKHPNVRMVSAHEIEALPPRVDARLPPEGAQAIRNMVEVLSRFSVKDLRGETSPAELRAKLFEDYETEAP